MMSVKSYEMSGGSMQQNKNTTNWQLFIETAWTWGRLNYIYILLAAVLCNCFLFLWILQFHLPFPLPTASLLSPSPSVFSLFSPPAFLISILVCLFLLFHLFPLLLITSFSPSVYVYPPCLLSLQLYHDDFRTSSASSTSSDLTDLKIWLRLRQELLAQQQQRLRPNQCGDNANAMGTTNYGGCGMEMEANRSTQLWLLTCQAASINAQLCGKPRATKRKKVAQFEMEPIRPISDAKSL